MMPKVICHFLVCFSMLSCTTIVVCSSCHGIFSPNISSANAKLRICSSDKIFSLSCIPFNLLLCTKKKMRWCVSHFCVPLSPCCIAQFYSNSLVAVSFYNVDITASPDKIVPGNVHVSQLCVEPTLVQYWDICHYPGKVSMLRYLL